MLFGRPLAAGDVVAALTLYSGGLTWRSCVTSLLRHTSEATPIVVFDDAGPSETALDELAEVEAALGREVHLYRQPVNRGVVGNLNTAFELLAPADVIVLNSDIIVGAEWDARLVAAARSRTDIATATALSSNATIFTVPGPGTWSRQPPDADEFEPVAAEVAGASARLRPFVPVATSFCTLFARHALTVVGLLDDEFSPGYGEEVDYSLRCVAHGFTHVAADDVYVYHATGESFGAVAQNQRKIDNDLLVSRRFPFWDQWIADVVADADSPLERVRHHAAAIIHGLTVVVDAELIDDAFTGTFQGAFALSRALALHPRVARLAWVAPAHRVAPLRALLDAHRIETIEVVALAELVARGDFVDIAFRPYQDFSGATWPAIAARAHRAVIWNLDLISVLNPHYSADYEAFAHRVAAVRRSWREADAIGVLTPHVAATLASAWTAGDGQVPVFLLPNGSPEPGEHPRPPWAVENRGIEALGDTPYVLVLGTGYLHKNVPWLMRVGLMVKSLGWAGEFVIAGPMPDHGDSAVLEADLLRLTGARCFHRLGRVTEHDKQRLLRGAELVITPSVTEGWGMIPAEAVAAGSVPLTTRGGGLADIAPADARCLGLRDDVADAQTIFELVTDHTARARQFELWEAACGRYRWVDSAQLLVDACLGTLLRRRRAPVTPPLPTPPPAPRPPSLRRRLADRSVVLLPVGSAPRVALRQAYRALFG